MRACFNFEFLAPNPSKSNRIIAFLTLAVSKWEADFPQDSLYGIGYTKNLSVNTPGDSVLGGILAIINYEA